jgi:hypothetical protein
MMKRITSVGPASLGHVGALVGLIFGIVAWTLLLADVLVSGALAGAWSVGRLGPAALSTLSYALIGWPIGFMVGFAFNRLAPRFGGLEVGLSDAD